MSEKPKLNNARLQSFGGYFAIYDVQLVDEKQNIYKGRPVMGPISKTTLPSNIIEADWVFFIDEYDDRNDWDRLYHQLSFDDNLLGQPFVLVPKEKLLFKYSPPTEGIVLPPVGMFGRG